MKTKVLLLLIFKNQILVLPEETQNTRKYNDTTIDMLPSTKGNLEYIKPLKISQNQYEDPRKYHHLHNMYIYF